MDKAEEQKRVLRKSYWLLLLVGLAGCNDEGKFVDGKIESNVTIVRDIADHCRFTVRHLYSDEQPFMARIEGCRSDAVATP